VQIRWFGQSAFLIRGERSVLIDPFGSAVAGLATRGLRFEYGEPDVLILPVGDGPTIGGERAAAIVRALRPRLVVPMHYRTAAVDFLEPPDEFLEALGARVEHLGESEFAVEDLLGEREQPVVALPAAPGD
jgi:L-ascorbate metabolism protein UlaG (beta-lactamase superfamily)